MTKLGFSAWLLGLCASLVNLLNFHGYSRPGMEIAILLGVFVVVSGLMAGVHKLAQPRLSFLFTALFIGVLIDFNADIGRGWFFAIVGAIAVTALLWERVTLKLTIAAFASVVLFQVLGLLVGFGKNQDSPNEAAVLQAKRGVDSPLRPIVHLVLDSYIGLEGMALPEAHFGTLRAEQGKFYLEQGFRVYPQTYSRHVKTVNSLPYLFSYGRAPVATTPRNLQHTAPSRLDYFIDLDRQGYRISALTPSFVDLCPNQPMTQCHNFNRSNLSSLLQTSLSSGERARVIGFTMVQLAAFTSTTAELVQRRAHRYLGANWRSPYNRTKLFSLSSLLELDAFTRDLNSLQYGEARVAHLLLPHDPYTFDATCHVLPEADWLDEHGPGTLQARDEAYANQVRCLTRRLGKMLDTLDKTPAGRDAIIVIHGDHGSRTIDSVPYIGGPTPDLRDLVLSHSAFFAIRIPGEPAASIPGRFALESLIGGFAQSGFTASPVPQKDDAEIFLMDANWIPKKRIRLPDYGRE